MHFALETESFVCDCATCKENEKLWSKGVAMYAFPYTTRELEIN